jgi:hypothetical protein
LARQARQSPRGPKGMGGHGSSGTWQAGQKPSLSAAAYSANLPGGTGAGMGSRAFTRPNVSTS